MMTPEVWRTAILDSVRSFADAEYQERVWVKGLGPEVEDIDEAYCRLFDDNDLDGFLASSDVATLLTDSQRSTLNSLRDLLNTFDFSGSPPDAVVIQNPKWSKIRDAASAVLAAFQRDD